jgi:hypothetical protein
VDANTEMARIEPHAIAAQAREAASNAAADVCFISCTAIRSAGLISSLEASLGIPVITSNQVLVWHALRTLGIGSRSPASAGCWRPAAEVRHSGRTPTEAIFRKARSCQGTATSLRLSQ